MLRPCRELWCRDQDACFDVCKDILFYKASSYHALMHDHSASILLIAKRHKLKDAKKHEYGQHVR